MADEAMLANFMPAAVLVNEKFDIHPVQGINSKPGLCRPQVNPALIY